MVLLDQRHGDEGAATCARRPAVSVAHIDNEELGCLQPRQRQRPAARGRRRSTTETLAHWTRHYGSSPLDWGDDIRLYRYAPHWMVGYAWKRTEVLAKRGITPA